MSFSVVFLYLLSKKWGVFNFLERTFGAICYLCVLSWSCFVISCMFFWNGTAYCFLDILVCFFASSGLTNYIVNEIEK